MAGSSYTGDFLSLEGAVLAQKYRLNQATGSDHLGTLFTAENLVKKKTVNIKVVPATYKVPGLFPFTDVHPCMVSIREIIRDKQHRSFVVTDQLVGETLSAMLTRVKRIEPGQAISIMCQLLSALDLLHSHNYECTYLSSDMIWVNKGATGGLEIQLFALPIAGAERETLNRPGYLAPEIIMEDGSADKRADLWAVGVLFHTMLYGTLPFDGGDLDEIYGKILLKDPAFPVVTPAVPQRLARIVKKLLKKEPERRFQKISDLAGELYPMLAGYNVKLSGAAEAAMSKIVPRAAMELALSREMPAVKASEPPPEPVASFEEDKKPKESAVGRTLIGIPAVGPQHFETPGGRKRDTSPAPPPGKSDGHTTSFGIEKPEKVPRDLGVTDDSSIILNIPLEEENALARNLGWGQKRPSSPPQAAEQLEIKTSPGAPAEISELITLPAETPKNVHFQFAVFKPLYYKALYVLRLYPYVWASVLGAIVLAILLIAVFAGNDEPDLDEPIIGDEVEISAEDAGIADEAVDEETPEPEPVEPDAKEPQTVTISLHGVPTKASIRIEDQKTALPLELSKSQTPVVIIIEADGYKPLQIEAIPDSNKSIDVALEKKIEKKRNKKRRRSSRRKKKSRRSKKKSSTKKKTSDWDDNPFK